MSFKVPQLPETKTIPQMAYEDLVEEIRCFQDRLSKEAEVGVIAGGGGLTLRVEQVRLSGQMIVFDGFDGDGREARLIQHYGHLVVQLIALPTLRDEPRRIGF